MKQAINFSYDDIHSSEMGVFIAWNGKGLFEENFLPNRTIVEKSITYREKPYFQRVDHNPLSFSLSFVIAEWENEDTLRKLARWFFQPYYKPLVFDTNPNRIFYAMFEGNSSLLHNGNKEGYIELNIRCDSPYSYSPNVIKEGNAEEVDKQFFTINQSTNFNGEKENIKVSNNLITIAEENSSTWEYVYARFQKWSEIK